jgi:hypothetical protein
MAGRLSADCLSATPVACTTARAEDPGPMYDLRRDGGISVSSSS